MDNSHSQLSRLYFHNVEKVTVNSKILDLFAFQNVRSIFIHGEIVSIESGTFKSFRLLKTLTLDIRFVRPLFHRGGIEWTGDMNSDVKVNLTDYTDIYREVDRIIPIYVESNSAEYDIIYTNLLSPIFINDVFPDEDLCLYEKFPFEQLLYIWMDQINNYSCTMVWLSQNKDIYNKYEWNEPIYRNLSQVVNGYADCEFENR